MNINMIIGLTADNYKNIPVSFILRMLRWSGVGFSEVTTNALSSPDRTLRSTRGMKLGLHLPNWGNCGFDFSSSGQKEKVESLLHKIDQYRKIFNFRYAVFHPPEENLIHRSYEFYIRNIRQIHIPLVLENIRSLSLKQFLEFYKRIKKELGNRQIGICLDIPHAILSGEDWKEYYHLLNSAVKVIHLSDCDEEDRHLPFGMGGTLDLDNILATLDKFGFDGILNFEIKPPSIRHLDVVFENYLQARKYFRPDGIRKIQQRKKLINLMGQAIGVLPLHK